MQKIYILPYTFKTYYHHDKRGSGIETSMLSQLKVLQELGYDVRLFAPLEIYNINYMVLIFMKILYQIILQ